MGESAAARIAEARRRAAAIPNVDDPLVVELLTLGFTWDGPGPAVVPLWATEGRQAVLAALIELKRRRQAEADREGRHILVSPGAVLGAVREKWAGSALAGGIALADALAVAPAGALAVAPAARSLSRAGAPEFRSGNSESDRTTTTPASVAGGGGEGVAEAFAALGQPGGVWHVARRRELAAYGLAAVTAAIELAKSSQADRRTPDWGRFVAAQLATGRAQDHAAAKAKTAAARANATAVAASQAKTAADNEAAKVRALLALAASLPAGVIARAIADEAAALPAFRAMLARRFPQGDLTAEDWARALAQEPRVVVFIAARLEAAASQEAA